MRVCFCVHGLGLSGGVGVIVQHARQLHQRGFDVTLALTEDTDRRWDYPELDGLRVLALDELSPPEPFDVAVGTWWATMYRLFEVPARRYAYFVQSLEDRFFADHPADRHLAALSHDLPVSFITEARWIAQTLRRLRPEAPCFYVRNGIDKSTFGPIEAVEPRTGGPLRVLVEGAPEVWFKAVGEAAASIQTMSAPRVATLVSPTGSAAGLEGFDRVVGPLSQRELAAVYAETDVLLKLSRVEGMFGPPLEGFHKGATCVVTPVTGHEEYVRHAWNAVVVDWDDHGGTGRWLDLLAQDRRYLHFLRTNALKTAEAWPAWHQQGEFMAAALQAIRRSGAAPDPHGTRQLLADGWAGANEMRRAAGRVIYLEQALEEVRGDLGRALDGVATLERARASLQQERAYVAGVWVRTRLHRLLGPWRRLRERLRTLRGCLRGGLGRGRG